MILELRAGAAPAALLPPLRLHPGCYTIGRAVHCDLVVAGSGIAPRHCEVRVGVRAVTLQRLGAGAAVAVNGKAVADGDRAALRSGDRLTLGSHAFEVTVSREIRPTADAAPVNAAPDQRAPLRGAPHDALFFRHAAALLPPGPGSIFAGYRIEESIGQGASAVVLRARRLADDLEVALKVLRPGDTIYAEATARLAREARAGGLLAGHPNLVRVYEAGRAGPFAYLALELVRGRDAEAMLTEAGPFAPERAVQITLAAAEALAYARRFGLIHRDVKPANILLGTDGTIRLLDLGLARVAGPGRSSALTRTGDALGTPLYMAPEQIDRIATIDHRADIYALGGTLYTLVAGHPPFPPGPLLEVLAAVQGLPAPPLRVTAPHAQPALERIVARCLEKDPSARYPDYAELIRDLRRVQHGPGERTRISRRRSHALDARDG